MKQLILLTTCLIAVVVTAQTVDRRQHQPLPQQITGVTADNAVPSDAIVLFDGSNLDAWITAETEQPAQWELVGDAMTVRSGMGNIKTRQRFGDMQLHLEWRADAVVVGEGQSRGNSGVFLHSLFEVQILDSWENPTYVNGQAASVYLQYPPLVNASRPPGQWQSYDILFQAPVHDAAGKLVQPAYLTLLHNGVLVQHHVPLQGATHTPMPEYRARCVPYGQQQQQDCSGPMPLTLQDHGQVVSFRNIWVREL